MTKIKTRRFQQLRDDIDAGMYDRPVLDQGPPANEPETTVRVSEAQANGGSTKVASFAGSSFLVTRKNADVTPNVAAPDLEVVVREHWLQKKLNALASRTIREWKHLSEDDRDDLKQEALLRLCSAHQNYHGRRRVENVESTEHWRCVPRLGWRKRIRTEGRASYKSFAGGVFANAMRRYAERTWRRFATSPLEDWDGQTGLMTDGTLSTLISVLCETKDGELLVLQALGYNDGEVASTNLRMRRTRAKARLAQNLTAAGFEIAA